MSKLDIYWVIGKATLLLYALTDVKIEDSDSVIEIGYIYEGSDEYGRNIVQVNDKGEKSVADAWEEGVFSSFKYEDQN